MKKTLVLLGLVAALVATASVLEPVTLTRTVKVGDTHKAKFTAELDFGGQTVTYSADGDTKVKEVKDDGTIVLEETSSNSSIEMDGQQQAAGNDSVATTTCDKTGKIVSIDGDGMSDEQYRFANLLQFIYPDKPVDKSDSWTVILPSSKEHGTPKTTCKYTVDTFEKVGDKDCVKVKFEITENEGDTPASSKGNMWIDLKSGFTLKSDGSLTNAPAGGMVINAKFKSETRN